MKNKTSKHLAHLKAAALLGICLSQLSAVSAQTLAAGSAGAKASAAITFANGSSVKLSSAQERFPTVGILPSEHVSIQLQLPARFLNTPVVVQPLDGGIANQNMTVAADGSASLGFQAGAKTGLYRVLLIAGGQSTMLRFWVLDQQDPSANPPVVTPTSGN